MVKHAVNNAQQPLSGATLGHDLPDTEGHRRRLLEGPFGKPKMSRHRVALCQTAAPRNRTATFMITMGIQDHANLKFSRPQPTAELNVFESVSV